MMSVQDKLRLKIAGIVVLAVLAGLVSYPQILKPVPPVYDFFNRLQIKLGLDLQGGIDLEYKADVSKVDSAKISDAIKARRM